MSDFGNCEEVRDLLSDVSRVPRDHKRKLSKWGPSYRIIHHSKQISKASGRTALCDSVLNDTFMSVPVGTEDQGSTFKRSQHDEVLHQCEDDRSELDWVIDQNLNTIRTLENISSKLSLCETAEEQRRYPWDLSQSQITALTRIYAEKVSDIFDGFRKNPLFTIEVVLQRLKQKNKEWQSARQELNLFWKEVYQRGAQKFWDGNVLLSRTSDQRLCSVRGLMSDIEAQHDGRFLPLICNIDDSEADYLQEQASSSPHGLGKGCPPTHHDIYYIMKSLEDGQRSRASARHAHHNFWATFVFPLFGVSGPAPSMPCPWIPQEGQFSPVKEAEGCREAPTRVLYATRELVLFLRLYHVVHHRLSQAKALSRRFCGRTKENVAAFVFAQYGEVANCSTLDDERAHQEPRGQYCVPVPQSGDIYSQYLQIFKDFLLGNVDDSRYEEVVRHLFGICPVAWKLCSIDVIWAALIQQLDVCIQHKLSLKVLQLFHFELSRPCQFQDEFYFEHSGRLFAHEEQCYFVSYAAGGCKSGGLRFCAVETPLFGVEYLRDKSTVAADHHQLCNSEFPTHCTFMQRNRRQARDALLRKRTADSALSTPYLPALICNAEKHSVQFLGSRQGAQFGISSAVRSFMWSHLWRKPDKDQKVRSTGFAMESCQFPSMDLTPTTPCPD
eukprot:EG_transcript_5890